MIPTGEPSTNLLRCRSLQRTRERHHAADQDPDAVLGASLRDAGERVGGRGSGGGGGGGVLPPWWRRWGASLDPFGAAGVGGKEHPPPATPLAKPRAKRLAKPRAKGLLRPRLGGKRPPQPLLHPPPLPR